MIGYDTVCVVCICMKCMNVCMYICMYVSRVVVFVTIQPSSAVFTREPDTRPCIQMINHPVDQNEPKQYYKSIIMVDDRNRNSN